MNVSTSNEYYKNKYLTMLHKKSLIRTKGLLRNFENWVKF